MNAIALRPLNRLKSFNTNVSDHPDPFHKYYFLLTLCLVFCVVWMCVHIMCQQISKYIAATTRQVKSVWGIRDMVYGAKTV